jgi:hypothetical protein
MKELRMLSVILLSALALVFAGCGDDDDDVVGPGEGPDIELVSPNGGEAINPGSVVQIQWTIGEKQLITVDLSYKADGMSEYAEIATEVVGESYDWTVPSENLFGVTVKAVATDDAGGTGDDASDGTFAIVPVSARNYVTSEICKTCHEEKYNQHRNSGHPWKLTKIEGGNPPTYPFSTVPDPPDGFSWNDITYVIGGYGWKARFMNSQGYIITTGVDGVNGQYNLPRDDLGGGLPEEWLPYEPNQDPNDPKEYTCGSCHTTGWQTFAENGGVHQDGLEGILGTWEETGVTCEQCHGAGGSHVATQSGDDININRDAELCGGCHFRDTNHRILASPPFIKHHEQYDEMISANHATRACTDCHEPHIGVRYGNAAAGGIKVDCQSCHTTVTSVDHSEPLECVDCHMARASKSA